MAQLGETERNQEISASTETHLPRPSPKEDFYLYVNYQWLRENSIPPSESRWGTFDILNHRTLERLKAICEGASENKDAEKGSNAQLVRDFYQSGMDMETRNRLGVEPISGLLSEIDRIKSSKDTIQMVATLHLAGISPFFDPNIDEDYKKAGSNAFSVAQGGLGMPDRDYYLSDDEDMQDKRGIYKLYVSKMFELSGREKEEADQAADSVFRLEHTLAEVSIPKEEEREIDKNYHKFTKDQAIDDFPGVDWDGYFKKMGVADIEGFVIMQPGFVKKVGDILQNEDLEDVKNYLAFTLLDDTADFLSEEFVSESFKFHEQVMQGLKEPKPLWKRTIQMMHEGRLTESLGPLYCEQYFNNEDKTRVMEIVGNVTDSFRQRVDTLDWMTDDTKRKTKEKLDIITFKMGYPDKWIDVSKIDIRSDSYEYNNLQLAEFESRRKLEQLGEPFDRTEWIMPPTLVNACSDLKREMTFPAAILQAPFYDPSADEAYNYGAIGMVVAHELTHFFDDQGSKIDKEGNINEWWSDKDRENFLQKSGKFVEHFGKHKANGQQVNGQLTLGENIADVAGMAIAFDAFQKYLTDNNSASFVDDMTPEQRFFVGYARLWAGKITPEKALQLALIDPHAPGEVRVNAVLSVTPTFLEAFDVKEGDTMYTPPDDRPKIW